VVAAASAGGARSLGHDGGTLREGAPVDAVVIDLDPPFVHHVPPEHAVDALFAAGTSAMIRQVVVAGREMV
jgi:cytosine/adenosine deaminase-related metal-dependent hydrolase